MVRYDATHLTVENGFFERPRKRDKKREREREREKKKRKVEGYEEEESHTRVLEEERFRERVSSWDLLQTEKERKNKKKLIKTKY